MWFPGFLDYMQVQTIHANAVYLSLGDREEKTRNPVMSKVGEKIRTAQELLYSTGVNCVLEWNKGNHFMESSKLSAEY